MNLLSRIFSFYINSSIHVALSVLALTYITVLEYSLAIHRQLFAFVFLGALVGYNFVKYAKIARLHHRDLAQSIRVIQIVSGICFILLIYLAFQLPLKVILLTAFFGLPTFFYAVPLSHHKNLRSLAGIKIFIVALVWAGVTVIIPVVDSGNIVSVDVLLTFFQRMLIVVVLIFPFEIRDVSYDSLNLKTLPQQIGVRNTKLLGEVILVLCLVLEFFKQSAQISYLLSILLFLLILGGMLIISKTHQNRFFSSFWVESLPITWLLFYMLFERL